MNIAIAVPPLVTVTLFDLDDPDEGAQVTEYVPGLRLILSVDVVPFEAPLTEKAQLPPTATATSVPLSPPVAGGGVGTATATGGGSLALPVGFVAAAVLVPPLLAGPETPAAGTALGVGGSAAATGSAVGAGAGVAVTAATGAEVAVEATVAASATGAADGALEAELDTESLVPSPAPWPLKTTSTATTESSTTAPATAASATFCALGGGLALLGPAELLGTPDDDWMVDIPMRGAPFIRAPPPPSCCP